MMIFKNYIIQHFRYINALSRTSERYANISIKGSKMFLYDARSLHRLRRDIAHKHPLLKLPHYYERVSRKFHNIPIMRKNLLYHRADITVQSF